MRGKMLATAKATPRSTPSSGERQGTQDFQGRWGMGIEPGNSRILSKLIVLDILTKERAYGP
jgi:hypothetical protein